MDMDRPADAALRIQCAADAALRIQCAARRRLAVHRASNALKLVVRARWGPLEGGACEAVLDTTRPAFPVVLLSADHPSIGRGHVVMPLAALVRAAQRLSVAPHSASSSSPAFSPPSLERVKSNLALRRLAPNNTALVEALRLSFLQAAAQLPQMLCLRPPDVCLVHPDAAREDIMRVHRTNAATRIQAVQRAYAARARVAVIRWRARARKDSAAFRGASSLLLAPLAPGPSLDQNSDADLEFSFEASRTVAAGGAGGAGRSRGGVKGKGVEEGEKRGRVLNHTIDPAFSAATESAATESAETESVETELESTETASPEKSGFAQAVLTEKRRRASLSVMWEHSPEEGTRPAREPDQKKKVVSAQNDGRCHQRHKEEERKQQREATAEPDLEALLNSPTKYFVDERTHQLTILYPDSMLSPNKANAKRMKKTRSKCLRWTGDNVMVDERGGWVRLCNPKTGQWGDYCELLEQTEDGYFRCAPSPSPRSKYAVVKQ